MTHNLLMCQQAFGTIFRHLPKRPFVPFGTRVHICTVVHIGTRVPICTLMPNGTRVQICPSCRFAACRFGRFPNRHARADMPFVPFCRFAGLAFRVIIRSPFFPRACMRSR
jgi:hypothetical protein